MSDEELLFDIDGDIGHITFNRPEARNVLTLPMYERLAGICTSITSGETELGALLISGAGGRAFASGTDISTFKEFRTREDALSYEQHIDRVLDAVERVPVPTIAVLQGADTRAPTSGRACRPFTTSASRCFAENRRGPGRKC